MATAPVTKVAVPVQKVAVPVAPVVVDAVVPVIEAVQETPEIVVEVPEDSLENDLQYEEAPVTLDPEEIHKAWLVDNVADGWTYGAIYDVDAKTSPWIRNYKALSNPEKLKFLAVQAVSAI